MPNTQIALTAQQSEQFLQLVDDLQTLEKLVITFRKPLTEADIRIGSVILRKWLIDGMLGRLCNSIGVKPTCFVLDNSKTIELLNDALPIEYFLTGGVKFSGIPILGVYESTAIYTGKPILPVEEMDDLEVGIGGLLDQERIYFRGTFFTCAEIIKFCANKAAHTTI
jgi:hypothetical protein